MWCAHIKYDEIDEQLPHGGMIIRPQLDNSTRDNGKTHTHFEPQSHATKLSLVVFLFPELQDISSTIVVWHVLKPTMVLV